MNTSGTKTETKAERKARQLEQHYARCAELARALRVISLPNGEQIARALRRAENLGACRALRMCNDSTYTAEQQQADKARVCAMVEKALGKLPPGFFVNGDPRGHALKIDNDNAQGQELIQRLNLHRDWGQYGILSPDIDGD
jgi:hypothetical protein